MRPLKKVNKGDGPENTIYDTAYANAIVDVINAVIHAQVSPHGMGRFIISKGKLRLKLAEKTLFFGIANGGALACWEICAKNVEVPEL